MGGVGGFKRTRKGLFTEFANQLQELDLNNPAHAAARQYRQGTIADLMLGLASIDISKNAAKTPEERTLADM